MSIARLPRLYFDGHFSWNPSTFNNDDYAANGLVPWDATIARPNWPWLGRQYYRGEPVTAANFRQWAYDDLFTLSDEGGPVDQLAPSEWNLFGGMECGFVTREWPVLQQPDNPTEPGASVFSKPEGDGTTFVTGYTGTNGAYHDQDAAVGLELQFNVAAHLGPFAASGKLIDIDPTSPFTSQVFVDDFRLGDGTDGFSAPISQRMHSRWLYFARNMNEDDGLMIAGIASTVMQTGMRHDEIDWTGASPALEELRAASAEAEGVMLRLTAYDTRYFNGPFFGQQGADQFPSMLKIRQLYQQYFRQLDEFENGVRVERPAVPCNRAYSRVVGWLGVWEAGEFVTAPGGRLLSPALAPNQPTGSPTPVVVQPRSITTVRKKSYPEGFPFGPATVERSSDFTRVTVDLCATVPEHDSTGTFGDFGSLDLGIMLDGQYRKLVTVLAATADYQPSYQRTAGIIDIDVSSFDEVDGVPVTPEQFDANPLVLEAWSCEVTSEPPTTWAANRVVALAENPLVAETDTRGLYVEEPDAEVPGPTTTFSVGVKAFNMAPRSQIGLVVAQYDDGTFSRLSGESRPLAVFYRDPTGGWLEIDDDTVVDATSGSVTLGLRGASGAAAPVGGALPLLFFFPVSSHLVAGTGLTPECPVTDVPGVVVPTGPAAGLPMPPAAFYAAVRVHPYHRQKLAEFEAFLTTGPDVAHVNSWVFAQVYETFHLMYPVMGFIASPDDLQAWRGRILEVTRPDYFDRSAYMPPTRTLTAAQREILVRYDEYLDGVNAPTSPLRTRASDRVAPRRG